MLKSHYGFLSLLSVLLYSFVLVIVETLFCLLCTFISTFFYFLTFSEVPHFLYFSLLLSFIIETSVHVLISSQSISQSYLTSSTSPHFLYFFLYFSLPITFIIETCVACLHILTVNFSMFFSPSISSVVCC